jgi:hypothetical protein
VATITSRIPALIDYLYNLWTADSTLGAAAGAARVTVFDGPTTTLDAAPLQLYVGLSNPDNPAGEPAGDSVQEWAALGRLGRNETTTIHCAALAWSGTDDMHTVRVAATGIVAAVETLMQNNTTQFGGNVLFPMPGITTISVTQSNQTPGSQCVVAFDLIFKSRIGGF